MGADLKGFLALFLQRSDYIYNVKLSEDEEVSPLVKRYNISVSEVGVAIVAFLGMCLVALSRPQRLLEPDDFAYRASIEAMASGHVTLTNSQYEILQLKLAGTNVPGPISQWIHMASGSWVSEKNPGYPFLVVIFHWLGIMTVAPLFYGLVACVSLFFGARRWLGKWGGTWAVVLFCSSGAAMVFAWRTMMPTFTDASLIAAGTGGFLWAVLASESSDRARRLVAVGAFISLELAVTVRYTNFVLLGVALGALFLTYWVQSIPKWFRASCLATVVLFGGVMMIFNNVVYGGYLNSGYVGASSATATAAGTFKLSALAANLEYMPSRLLQSMPMLVIAVAAMFGLAYRFLLDALDATTDQHRLRVRLDVAVGLLLALSWAAIWGLYSLFTWTAQMGAHPGEDYKVIRFFLPALGVIALLASWLIKQLPRWCGPILLLVIAVIGVNSFGHLYSNQPVGPRGPGQDVPGFGVPNQGGPQG